MPMTLNVEESEQIVLCFEVVCGVGVVGSHLFFGGAFFFISIIKRLKTNQSENL
jgi:hypothetical protein